MLINVWFIHSLTEREKREREHKKQLLQLAKEHEKAREMERVQRYHMPHEKGKDATEPEIVDIEPPQSEQSKWESDQMSSAVFRFGAKDRKGDHSGFKVVKRALTTCVSFIISAKQDYDLLLEDEVEFVQALQIPGSSKDKKRALSPPRETKTLTTIEETQKSLPIYPFKNDLIQAIRDHQVIHCSNDCMK